MSRLGTPSSLASGAPSGAATPVTTDLYRPIAAQIQRSITPLAGTATQSLASLLGLDSTTYSSRLSGKNLLLTDLPNAAEGSALVVGRKRNRGDPRFLAQAKAAVDEQAEEKRRRALGSIRKARKGKPVVGSETRIDYATLLPLHYLHIRYMSQLLALPPCPASYPSNPTIPPPPTVESHAPTLLPGLSPEGLQSKLVKADLVGSVLRVKASRNPSLVGVKGIVIEETAGSFRLLGEDGRVRVAPKDGSQLVLSFPLYAPPADTEEGRVDYAAFVNACPQIEVDILGSSFAFRSGDRSGRKFRPAQGWGGSGWGEEWVKGEWSFLNDLGTAKAYGVSKARKRNKSRRKDPLVQGSLQVL